MGTIIVLAGLLGAILTGLGMATYVRRRSRPYLLVALAFLALLARSILAGGALLGVVPADVHHVLEHGLDFAMAALVVAAVIYAKRIEESRPANGGASQNE